jgi:hypothetical protein
MAALLTDIGSFFTAIVTYIGDIAGLFTTEPVFVLTVSMVVVGFTVGIFGRLLRRG